ncbi:virulence factor family protein [Ginsengibacter hankyongi]|uniref:Virulence factor family protein n=1 Tax=Ginsengibacter hankyongi TaxID=2607284 RepID=A0A5J5ILL6_9BACT|nr:AcvB/VirJ family lysyl-phosphatidylglycerol hydrolase [Ginsengibacter hankyongi]KAA9041253.1 virulence factor family protein [Ginsengibacter hankyongi]
MKKIILLALLSTPILHISVAVAQDLPVKEWATSSQDKPLIFYLSGDGGFNKFSNSLCQGINKKGFDVIALNSKSYFWDKKTPEQTATDVNNYLANKLTGRKNQQVVIIGYSFGADVLPFILNRLPKEFHDKILASFLMASSGSTDFEIHWSDIFGGNSKREMDVVTEINKLVDDKIVIISASDDGHLALNKISLKRYTHEVLPGGHHFDGDTDEIIKVILNDME